MEVFFCLFNVLISVTTVFEGIFSNFNAVRKADNFITHGYTGQGRNAGRNAG